MSHVIDIDACIVVLGDGSTYDTINGGEVVFMSKTGEEQLLESDDFKHVDESNVIERVSVRDLVECWLRNTQNT
jgi:hypothetical protein